MTKNTTVTGYYVVVGTRLIDVPQWIARIAEKLGLSVGHWQFFEGDGLRNMIHELGGTDR